MQRPPGVYQVNFSGDDSDDMDESLESSYRRGYRDGFRAALDAFHGLMFRERKTRLAAYDEAWDFCYEEIEAWLDQEPRHERINPPDMPLR